MSQPVSADNEKLGPGTLKIGATGSEIDASCLVNGLRITATANRGDSKTMLCGTTKAGSVRYDYEMTGNLDLDTNAGAAGLFALSQQVPGSTQDFSFIPNTAGGTEAAGQLILDPLDFGADEYGTIMNSDVAFVLIGQPTYTYGTGTVAITGVTAGTPGAFIPANATLPATLTALKAHSVVGDTGTNKPSATPWTTGQYVVLGDASHAHWSGTAWVTGPA
jgi:hypothetical protein